MTGIKIEPSVVFAVAIITRSDFSVSDSFNVVILCTGYRLDCQGGLFTFNVPVGGFRVLLPQRTGPCPFSHPRHRLPQFASRC